MAETVIRMPDIGEGVTEAEVVEWNVAPGQVVMEDQALLSVMTDKASVELPAPVTGTVLSLAAAVGDMVAVGAPLVVIQTSDSAAPPAAARNHEPATVTEPSPACEAGADAALEPDPEPTLEPPPAQTLTGKPLASPAVRRRARELGITLNEVRGSGPKQRITHADLDAHRATPSTAVETKDTVTHIKLTGLRRRIAQRMEIATREIPHITYVEEVDVTQLEALREHLNGQPEAQRPRLSVLPFVAMAVVRALAQFPRMNAHYDSEVGILHQHTAIQLGVATQTPAGLMVPVIRNAQALDLWSVAGEILRLAQAARSGEASRSELTGSTITLSSLGSLGGLVSTPVINHPEVAIVGVNRVRTAPVLAGGQFVPHQLMNLSSSFDHRIVDGWDAASFIQRIRIFLEHPATLFMKY